MRAEAAIRPLLQVVLLKRADLDVVARHMDLPGISRPEVIASCPMQDEIARCRITRRVYDISRRVRYQPIGEAFVIVNEFLQDARLSDAGAMCRSAARWEER